MIITFKFNILKFFVKIVTEGNKILIKTKSSRWLVHKMDQKKLLNFIIDLD